KRLTTAPIARTLLRRHAHPATYQVAMNTTDAAIAPTWVQAHNAVPAPDTSSRFTIVSSMLASSTPFVALGDCNIDACIATLHIFPGTYLAIWDNRNVPATRTVGIESPDIRDTKP